MRVLIGIGVLLGAAAVATLVLTSPGERPITLTAHARNAQSAPTPTETTRSVQDPNPVDVEPGLASRPAFEAIEIEGVPRPSDLAREEGALFMRRARFFMGLGVEEPVESLELHLVANREVDPVTRAILDEAVQAWCRGAFAAVYTTLGHITEEAPAAEYPDMEEWERAVNADPIEIVIDRWRAGEFYAPEELRDVGDRDTWLARRAAHGVNAQATHCEHQGSFEAWAATVDDPHAGDGNHGP